VQSKKNSVSTYLNHPVISFFIYRFAQNQEIHIFGKGQMLFSPRSIVNQSLPFGNPFCAHKIQSVHKFKLKSIKTCITFAIEVHTIVQIRRT